MKILVPASTSNLGAGFDTFGLALELYNSFEFEPAEGYSLHVEGEGQDLPRDENNLFVRSYKRACQFFGLKEEPLRIVQKNRVPTGRGLGSSATAIVGGIMACLRLNGLDAPLEDVLKVAFEFEPHPDNILPALVGGFVVCATDGERVSYVKLDFPKELKVVVCVPEFELSTKKAREVLRKEVPLWDAVYNVQRSALLVASLMKGRFDLLKEAVKDRLHQPYRAGLVPGFYRVLDSAYSAGAVAVFLSGAGPTVASLCLEKEEQVGRAMVGAFEGEGIRSKYLVLGVSERGALDY
mgnify:CR=1 FL=1